ncbi:aldo/keto reductase family domain-containing protein [Ditylenchus destructor]|nr:aldo/keto reductase family domain-containing protein [Ditylenchus destructor]
MAPNITTISWRRFSFCTRRVDQKDKTMSQIPTIKLHNGVSMPMLGYGTFLSNNPEELKAALRLALDAGYRYIDTAHYYNNENVIGDVLQEYYKAGKLKRSDVFIATKLAIFGHSNVDFYLKQSLANLKTDYIDLYLMHSAMPFKEAGKNVPVIENGNVVPDMYPRINTWRAFEKHYKAGLVRSIGICNYNAKQLEELYNQAEIKPHNLQIELHILLQQHELVGLCRKLNMSVTAYGPLGSPGSAEFRQTQFGQPHIKGDCLGHPLVKELSRKYNKSPAQILLRQIVQRGVTVIPKSTNPTRIKENCNVFDFKLSDEDMKRMADIQENIRFFTFEFCRIHPWYPW